ncbi:hypothetical protein OZX69_01430 [Lactobacillus sp. ESL0731]|uniref:hypothetical protein n=1 Tax=unclassified Lactobacillus TaxID=2620435 RepID=UPI0023F87666|nr:MULTISPECIES: hypothetical protein [unclassified Lactobacillus]WEV51411.1 hypothetical protein OZX63_01430 [Lactobacillus sp. ESL0700]WEV62541.1 hypothetical protein OZX69_01430 [Lactobacillus sp. ESL0731]
MKIRVRKGGYSADVVRNYVDLTQPIQSLSSRFDEVVKFVDGKPTNEVVAYKAWFTQEGVGPFQVKFTKKAKLPKYLSIVEFDNLEACEVNYNVYFRAVNVKEIR